MKIKIKPLSVNAAWQGKRYKTKEYKSYEQELFWKLPDINIPEGELHIEFIFGLSSKNADWDNPIKPFQDILQKKYGFDDKRIFSASVQKKIVKKGEEFISFFIEKFNIHR